MGFDAGCAPPISFTFLGLMLVGLEVRMPFLLVVACPGVILGLKNALSG
jgi:hypothetical protein